MAHADKIAEVLKRVEEVKALLTPLSDLRNKRIAMANDAEEFTSFFDDETDEEKHEDLEDTANSLGNMADKLEELENILSDIDDLWTEIEVNLQAVKDA